MKLFQPLFVGDELREKKDKNLQNQLRWRWDQKQWRQKKQRWNTVWSSLSNFAGTVCDLASKMFANGSILSSCTKVVARCMPLGHVLCTTLQYSQVKLIDSIVKQLFRIEQKGALVLVVVLDHGKDTQDTTEEETAPQGGAARVDNIWQKAATASRMAALKECYKRIISHIVEIPTNDCFNLTNLVRELTGKEEVGELFSSHSFVGVFDEKNTTGCRKNDSGKTDALLTEGTTKDVKEKLNT
eukprot:scaffold709029_cov63-Attheya_sp.AAC.1